MKKYLFIILTLILQQNFAFAQTVPAKLNYLNCQGFAGGTTSIVNNISATYSGVFVTITAIPVFGLPFIQQAKVIGAYQHGNSLDIKLHTMLTNADLTLRLVNKTTQGYLAGTNGNAIPMTCQASISR